MTNVQGAATEAQKLAKAYTTINNSDLSFYIPVYDNMPNQAAAKLTGNGDPNNYLKNLNVNGYSLNPIFDVYTQEYSLIINSADAKVNITAEPYETTSSVTGAGDITLVEGMNNLNITVTAQNGMTRTYELTISKSGGNTGDESVENPENLESGTLTDTIGAYTVANGYLTGISQMVDVETFISNMDIADVKVKVYRSDKEIVSGYAGTGSKVKISDTSDNVIEEYTILIFGDINGDGKISISDLLKMQKVLLGLEQVDGVYIMAADVNRDGKTSIVDLLKIQKSLLQLEKLD